MSFVINGTAFTGNIVHIGSDYTYQSISAAVTAGLTADTLFLCHDGAVSGADLQCLNYIAYNVYIKNVGTSTIGNDSGGKLIYPQPGKTFVIEGFQNGNATLEVVTDRTDNPMQGANIIVSKCLLNSIGLGATFQVFHETMLIRQSQFTAAASASWFGMFGLSSGGGGTFHIDLISVDKTIADPNTNNLQGQGGTNFKELDFFSVGTSGYGTGYGTDYILYENPTTDSTVFTDTQGVVFEDTTGVQWTKETILQFGNGPTVSVEGDGEYTLTDGNGNTVLATVDFDLLPTVDETDEIYIFNGGTFRAIEKLKPRFVSDPRDGFFVDCGLTYDGRVDTVPQYASIFSGLDHLEGQTVAVIADGSDIGRFIVKNGTVTIPNPALVVHIGLPITSDFETLNLASARSDITDKKKMINAVSVIVDKSKGFQVGPDVDHLDDYKLNSVESYDDDYLLVSGNIDVGITATWNKIGRVFIRQSKAEPVNILAVIPQVEIGGF